MNHAFCECPGVIELLEGSPLRNLRTEASTEVFLAILFHSATDPDIDPARIRLVGCAVQKVILTMFEQLSYEREIKDYCGEGGNIYTLAEALLLH